MTRGTKTIIAMLMSLALVFAVTACGSKTEPETEAEPQTEEQTETQQETTETPAEYDIASNLRLAGGGITLSTARHR